MGSRVRYDSRVYKDLKKIDKPIRQLIMDKITNNLSKIPPEGKMLTGDLKGLCSYRIGDYRALYVKVEDGVLVLNVRHRREVYK